MQPANPTTNSDFATGWAPDVLGSAFESLTLELAPDEEGDVVATLVRALPTRGTARDAGIDVLYVHGWSDYYFQTNLAEYFASRGIQFYAIDLRKYGRSLREHQTPGFVDDLAIYDEDIEAALAAIGHGDGHDTERTLLLMGHSTGGLTLSLWASRHRGRARGLILNSPWLEFQAGQVGRNILTPVIGARATLRPHAELPNVDLGYYSRALSKKYDGEWVYNDRWRPHRGFPVTSAWLSAILHAHATVAAGLSIDIPILVMLSATSTLAARWHSDMLRSDSVLDVAAVARRSLDLGRLTTIARIEDALHDVILSPEPVRTVAYSHIDQWLFGLLGDRSTTSAKHSWRDHLGRGHRHPA